MSRIDILQELNNGLKIVLESGTTDQLQEFLKTYQQTFDNIINTMKHESKPQVINFNSSGNLNMAPHFDFNHLHINNCDISSPLIPNIPNIKCLK